MQAKKFENLITLTRSSIARYYNSSGIIVQAAVNEPRFEYDPETLAPLGLKLEPARTNTFTYSQDFTNAAWVKTNISAAATSVVAPDGSATALKMSGSGVAGASNLQRRDLAFTAATAYSLSVFVKADTASFIYLALPAAAFGVLQQVNFNLAGAGSFIVISGAPSASIRRLPNGWFRLSISATTTASMAAAAWVAFGFNQATTTGVVLWGAQLEVGPAPSSYVPAVVAAATRSADNAYIDDLSPWMRAGEGTLYAEFSDMSGPSTSFFLSLGTTSSSVSRIALWSNTNKISAGQVLDDSGGTSFGQSIGTAVSLGQRVKQALAFRKDDFQMAVNGQLGAVDTSGILPTVSRLTLGARGLGTTPMSGHLRTVRYYPYRLTPSELQAITT